MEDITVGGRQESKMANGGVAVLTCLHLIHPDLVVVVVGCVAHMYEGNHNAQRKCNSKVEHTLRFKEAQAVGVSYSNRLLLPLSFSKQAGYKTLL